MHQDSEFTKNFNTTTMTALNKESLEIENPLQRIARYYLTGKGLPTKKQEDIKQIGATITAAAACLLYVDLAKRFADEYPNAYLHFGHKDLDRFDCIAGTIIPSMSVLMKALQDFLEMRENKKIPKELEDILISSQSITEQRINDAIVFLGSAASAVPLAILAFVYPLYPALWVQIPLAIVAEGANTGLHFLPFMLMSNNLLYRFPGLPLELPIRAIYNCKYPKPEKVVNEIGLKAQEKLNELVIHAQQDILLKWLEFDWRTCSYKLTIPTEFKNSKLNATAESDLLFLLQDQFKREFVFQAPPRFPKIHSALSTLREPVKQLLSIGVSARSMISGCAGYAAAPIMLFLALTNSPTWTSFIVSIPIYTLTALLFYIGHNMGKLFFDYLTTWGANEPKLSLEFKQHPKKFAFAMLFIIYLAIWSYAAAEELIYEAAIPLLTKWFGEKFANSISSMFIWDARIGVPILSVYALEEWFAKSLRKADLFSDKEDIRFVTELMVELQQLNQAWNKTDLDILAKYKDFLVTLGVMKDFTAPQNNNTNNESATKEVNQKSSCWGWKIPFFSSSSSTSSSFSNDSERDVLLTSKNYTTPSNNNDYDDDTSNEKQSWSECFASLICCSWFKTHHSESNEAYEEIPAPQ